MRAPAMLRADLAITRATPRRSRRRVAAVEEGVHERAAPLLRGQLDDRREVALVAVHAAVGEQAEEVQARRAAFAAAKALAQHGFASEVPSAIATSMRVMSW